MRRAWVTVALALAFASAAGAVASGHLEVRLKLRDSASVPAAKMRCTVGNARFLGEDDVVLKGKVWLRCDAIGL